jgi:glycosyltransferase involved in cell wall biosynthesis
VPYEDTWKYIKGFDVGIIPFKINRFTEGVLPYKFFEYIACGIPVVSTALPELKQFSEIIKVCSTDNEFTDFCINRDPSHIVDSERYSEIAENSTWKKRAEQITNLIKEKLNI